MNSNSEDPDPKSDIWELRLYVAGQTAKSVTAFQNLRRICDEHLAGKHRIEVVDLLTSPLMAREDQIVVIPTLVRRVPAPVRKIVGDLSNSQDVLIRLQLPQAGHPPERNGGPPQE